MIPVYCGSKKNNMVRQFRQTGLEGIKKMHEKTFPIWLIMAKNVFKLFMKGIPY